MAEAGSFADRVKQQADIVRVVGEYVRLKKSGQNFTGLCPFHGEKRPRSPFIRSNRFSTASDVAKAATFSAS
jgi:hypothetical protein